VLGPGQATIEGALQEVEKALPFRLLGVDSDNGSEFINWHLQAWCQRKGIQLTRGRPYKKDDNAHVEQKNWTHVRKLLGWDRYDSLAAVEALNDVYRHELRLWLNLFLPSVKLVKKVRVGSKLRRVYDTPQTPLQRVASSPQAHAARVAELQSLRESLNPFALAKAIDQKLEPQRCQVRNRIVCADRCEAGADMSPASMPLRMRAGFNPCQGCDCVLSAPPDRRIGPVL